MNLAEVSTQDQANINDMRKLKRSHNGVFQQKKLHPESEFHVYYLESEFCA